MGKKDLAIFLELDILKMSNSKKITKSFFPILKHFFLVFYFIMIYGKKVKK